jgi:hypothetical protein
VPPSFPIDLSDGGRLIFLIAVDLARNQVQHQPDLQESQNTMVGAKFDIFYAGGLIGDADPNEVRRHLQQRFKLSDEAAARLFSGRKIAIKLGVDTATASRYLEVFRDAKALVEISPAATSETPAALSEEREIPPEPAGQATPAETEPRQPSYATGEQQSKAEGQDEDGVFKYQNIDISYLSLVPGWDWTLEDCQPPQEPTKLPDISHLEIVAPASDGYVVSEN